MDAPTVEPAAGEAAAIGRRVIETEARALRALAASLGAVFDEAVARILDVPGRVIVSGMGKSGHVARKIAATLASTGTPAQFVHPAEASHGDLGMVTTADLALVLSNSGETRELADIVAHSRRFSIPLLSVVGRAGSALARRADIALVLPDEPEACPQGLAPTSSTAMMMALGDALAIALMERRRFTPERFAMFHPGGKLGARLVRVADLMHTGPRVPLVPEATPMRETLEAVSAGGFGIVGVTDAEGRLAGVITDGDIRRNIVGLLDRRAGEVATRSPKVVAVDALAGEAVAIMNAAPRPALCLFVLDGDARPIGVLHVHDCLRAGVEGA